MIHASRRIVPVHIIGRKNSGKTTLICELVRELSAQDLRVGTVKHTSHVHELDTPGKDSQLHRAAGAAIAGIVSPGLCAAFWPSEREVTSADERYARLLKVYGDCDVILIEGDTLADSPKIEVWRAATDGAPFANSGIDVRAVVTDDPLDCPVPIWPRSDVPRLARRILDLAGIPTPSVEAGGPLARR